MPDSGSERVDGFILAAPFHRGALSTICRITGVDGRPPIPFPAIMKRPRSGVGEGAESVIGFETETRILPWLSRPMKFVLLTVLRRSMCSTAPKSARLCKQLRTK